MLKFLDLKLSFIKSNRHSPHYSDVWMRNRWVALVTQKTRKLNPLNDLCFFLTSCFWNDGICCFVKHPSLPALLWQLSTKFVKKPLLHLTSWKNRENFLRGASAKRFGKSVSNRLKSILKLIFRVFWDIDFLYSVLKSGMIIQATWFFNSWLPLWIHKISTF